MLVWYTNPSHFGGEKRIPPVFILKLLDEFRGGGGEGNCLMILVVVKIRSKNWEPSGATGGGGQLKRQMIGTFDNPILSY